MSTRALASVIAGGLNVLRFDKTCISSLLLASSPDSLTGIIPQKLQNIRNNYSGSILQKGLPAGLVHYSTTSCTLSPPAPSTKAPANRRPEKARGAAEAIIKSGRDQPPLRPVVQDGVSPSIAKGQQHEDMDPLEFMIWLKERFMRQDLGISDGVKEVIFKNHWDKVLVDVRRTVKVTRSMKLETYHAIACVGNFEGLFGVGIASSNNSQSVVGEAYLKAYQNLVPIPLYRGHTIYHRIEHKFHTVQMILMPRPEGWGIRANDMLQELCTMIGIKNISVKVLGRRNRRNKFNVVKCFLEALQKQSTPHDGIEMMGVYAREVFYKQKLPLGLTRGVDIPG